jgi:hypothetical protein
VIQKNGNYITKAFNIDEHNDTFSIRTPACAGQPGKGHADSIPAGTEKARKKEVHPTEAFPAPVGVHHPPTKYIY